MLTPAQIAARLRLVLERIDQTLDDNGREDWTADRQLCLEDVESALSALVEDIEARRVPGRRAVS
jgi:hypothetical protein